MIGALTNHLWQSTVLAVAVGLIVQTYRRNRAHVRYWLWFSASIKFLVPFSLLISLGSHLGWTSAAASQLVSPDVSLAAEQIAQPFSGASLISRSTKGTRDWVPDAVVAIWMCGMVTIALLRLRGWRRIRAAVRVSTSMDIPANVEVRRSPGILEPGVVGWVHPILLLPAGITNRLTAAQLQAVVAHELCHVRRRDNLLASIHMLIEAVFWFHPLVWWIGARLLEERERACDEEVLRLGSEPRVYADAILNVCKLYVDSPLSCVSGVTGSHLNKRIEAIMTNRVGLNLNLAKKATLAVAGVCALSVPVVIGMMNATAVRAQSPVVAPKFDRVSIRACTSDEIAPATGFKAKRNGERRVEGSPGNLGAPCQTVASLIRDAYLRFANATDLLPNPSFSKRLFRQPLTGSPDWINTERYTIEAKAASPQSLEMMRGPMMQALLEDRFKLKIHREAREIPIYELSVAPGGPRLQTAQPGSCVPFSRESAMALDAAAQAGGRPPRICGGFFGDYLYGTTMAELCAQFSALLGRDVIDKTGLAGAFDIYLDSFGQSLYPDGGAPKPDATAKFIAARNAVEKLGLQLAPANGSGEFLVIDAVEKPNLN